MRRKVASVGVALLILMLLPALAAAGSSAPVLPAVPHGACEGQCWRYNEGARTLTWAGPADGSEDVWQGDELSLGRLRGGWTAGTAITSSTTCR